MLTEAVRIDNQQRLGIGTNPATKFQIASVTGSWTTSNWARNVIIGNNANAQAIQFGYGSGNRGGIAYNGTSFYFLSTTADDNSAAPNYSVILNNNGTIGANKLILGQVTGTPDAILHIIKTTEQLRLGYDASNYVPFTVSLAGDLNIAPSGGDVNVTGNETISGYQQSAKVRQTLEGGVAIKLTNKTGANSVKGTVVYADPAVDNAFEINPINGDMPIGVVYESGVADGSECWVVVSGIAEVLLVNTVASTRSYIAYSSATVAGRIDIAATVPVAATHFKEIGHTLENKAGGTDVLCKCVLHFN